MTKPTPAVKRIVRRDGAVVEIGDRAVRATVWVGLGPLNPDRDDPDDFTLPEVIHRYLTKAALRAAMTTGDAYL